MELLVKATGILLFLIFGLMGYFSTQAKLPQRYQGLQLTKSVKEVGEIIVDREGTALDDIRKSMDADNSRLIPLYWLLFIVIALILARQNSSLASRFAVAASLSITAAAGLDYLENFRTLEVVQAILNNSASDELVGGMRLASLGKWLFFFLTMGLLAPTFFWRIDWIQLVGYLYLAAFFLGWTGLFYPPAIQWAFMPLILALPLSAFIFAFWPVSFLKGN